jgi:hypothetical protein
MEANQQEITRQTVAYIDVLRDTFSNADDDIIVYAKYLAAYEQSLNSSGSGTKSIEPIKWTKEQIEGIHKEIMKVEARKYICAGLKVFADEVWEAAKAVAPILITLQLTGVISLPSSSLVYFSLACIMIARVGSTVICVGLNDD